MPADDAITFHSQIADEFDSWYKYGKDFIERNKIWTSLINKYSSPTKDVLDVGCGGGIFSLYSAERNRRVIGIDASNEMLAICCRKQMYMNLNNITFLKCDIISLNQLIDHKVDLIICSSVLEYVDYLDNALAIIVSLLKKDGIFIFSLPNKSSLYRKFEPVKFKLTGRPAYYKYVQNVVKLNEITIKLKQYGLSVLESVFYAKTPFLSKLFDNIGLSKYSDNLFLVVAQQSEPHPKPKGQ